MPFLSTNEGVVDLYSPYGDGFNYPDSAGSCAKRNKSLSKVLDF